MVQEFLPLCDVLFNIISLASYFCDLVFDVVTVYTLYAQNQIIWFFVALSCILFSLLVSQLCSLGWYIGHIRRGEKLKGCRLVTLITVHVLQAGVLLRYFKLFVPVDLRHVKNDVRDLCLLRLIHAFCEAAPMLLLQLYLIWLKSSFSEITDLNIVSTAFSLFSVCWALASFNKNVRKHNVHRLVLTWLGVIFQLLWRLGTITSRALALTAYATLYGYWVFLVIALHWVSMFLWLISPRNVFHGERMPFFKRIFLSMLIAFCYIFCYINLQEINPRQKMVAFYLTMVLENTLLVSVWLGGLNETPWYQHSVSAIIFLSYIMGIIFMVLYYRHFHVKRLKHAYHPHESDKLFTSCTNCQLGDCTVKSHRASYPHYFNELTSDQNDHFCNSKLTNIDLKDYQERPLYPYLDSLNVPGVFNCRFNPVIKRKKKKPTSFVPPPVQIGSLRLSNNASAPLIGGRLSQPFWKCPLPNPASSDHEGSIGSRVNIQQKLQEKKQQQIAELRKIEEEIRAGKLKRPQPGDITDSGTQRQPIPSSKKQPWMKPTPIPYSYVVSDPSGTVSKKPRSQTPEILLAPHYLENSRIYYEYQDTRYNKYGKNYHLPSDEMSGSSLSKQSLKKIRRLQKNDGSKDKVLYKSYRIPSDLDSQISLPRSYTLPREFRYYRRPKSRKTIRVDHFLASTNSSDGDVDSCDEIEQQHHGMPPTPKTPNGIHIHHPGHPHHHHPHNHYHHHRQTMVTPRPEMRRTASPHIQAPLKARINRNQPNTHETKL